MELISWGANSHGQLGQGTFTEQCSPSIVLKTWNIPIKHISCGGGHTLFLDSDGQVYGCGWNQQKQLGFESDKLNDFKVPSVAKIWELSGIVFDFLCTGWDSSAGITNKNILYIWGSNSFGQLGLPKEHFPKYIKPIQLELRVKYVSMGLRHTILVDVNGCMWATGRGKHGELGLGREVLTTDSFRKIIGISNIDKVACGQHHTVAWSKLDNKIYSWGSNTYGQLGSSDKNEKISSPREIMFLREYVEQVINIYSGWTHSAVLLRDGRAVFWGRNDYGQLGSSCASDYFNIVVVNGLMIKQLSVGSEHSTCVTEDGTLWSWGWNEHNNTGTGDTHNVLEPRQVQTIFKCNEGSQVFSGAGNNYLIVA